MISFLRMVQIICWEFKIPYPVPGLWPRQSIRWSDIRPVWYPVHPSFLQGERHLNFDSSIFIDKRSVDKQYLRELVYVCWMISVILVHSRNLSQVVALPLKYGAGVSALWNHLLFQDIASLSVKGTWFGQLNQVDFFHVGKVIIKSW